MTIVSKVIANRAIVRRIDPNNSPRTAEALQVLDIERVSSAPALVAAYHDRAAEIRRDPMLSDAGKQSKIQGAATSTLGNIAAMARRIVEMETEHRAESGLVPLPEPTASDTLIDLALAAQIKADPPTGFALEHASERTRIAVARLPRELSGLSAELQVRAHASLTPASDAARIAAEATALDAARQVVQQAIGELQTDARWQPAELVKAFGNHWKLPGIVETLANRLAAADAA